MGDHSDHPYFSARHLPDRAPIGDWEVFYYTLAFTILAAVALCFRWYTRAVIVRKIGVEDWLLTAAQAFLIANLVIGACLTRDGERIAAQSAAQEDPNRNLGIQVAKMLVAQNAMFTLAVNLVKAALLTQYLRVFQNKIFYRFRVICCFLLVAVFGVCVGTICGLLFACGSISEYWMPVRPGNCANNFSLWGAVSFLGIILDWAIWILPMPIIRKLKLPRRQMFALLLIFAMGGFTCAISIARVIESRRAEVHGKWKQALIWATIEPTVGVICASVSALFPLVKRVCPSIMHESSRDMETLDSIESGWSTGASTFSGNPFEKKSHEYRGDNSRVHRDDESCCSQTSSQDEKPEMTVLSPRPMDEELSPMSRPTHPDIASMYNPSIVTSVPPRLSLNWGRHTARSRPGAR